MHSTAEIVALVWDNHRVEIWDGRRRARPRATQEPRCNWSTVTKVEANEGAIAAILENGGVIAYGREAAGGILPDLVNRDRAKRMAVDLFATRFAFLVTLSNRSAIIWGDIAEKGLIIEKEGNDICQVSSTCCAFAVRWSDGTVTTRGIPEGGGSCDQVVNLLSSVKMLKANTSSFAALSGHDYIVCWGDPMSGGTMESAPAKGVVDIVSTRPSIRMARLCAGELPGVAEKGQITYPPTWKRCMQQKELLLPIIETVLLRHGATPSLEGSPSWSAMSSMTYNGCRRMPQWYLLRGLTWP